MSSFVNQTNIDDDSKIINTLNHHQIYPCIEMFINSKQGIYNFEKIVAKKVFIQVVLCAIALAFLHKYFDLGNQKAENIYILGIFSSIYILFQTLRILNKKEEILVKTLFHQISQLGEKNTLIYFLATLRKSSFISNKDYFTSALDAKNYKVIHEQFSRIFEIIHKENSVYRPITPTKNLLPIK